MTLGEKIKTYRKAKDLSQLELETAISASNGMISRIESGQINPTKETILKIIDSLQLTTLEAADLFEIEPANLSELVTAARKLSSSLDLDHVLQNAINEIVYSLNLLTGAIFLVKGDKVYAQKMTQTTFNTITAEAIGVPFERLNVSLREHTDNIIVQTIVNRKSYYTESVLDVTHHAIPDALGLILGKIAGMKSGITLPIVFEGESVGALFLCKKTQDNYEKEMPILLAFADHIAYAVKNAQKYGELMARLNSQE